MKNNDFGHRTTVRRRSSCANRPPVHRNRELMQSGFTCECGRHKSNGEEYRRLRIGVPALIRVLMKKLHVERAKTVAVKF